jgi:adenosylcobinamide-GDP ribazoletransferase
MTRAVRQEWHLFLLAVQFMTRLPVPAHVEFSDARLFLAARYYPLVGLTVGGIGALVLALSALALPVQVAVVLSMASTIWVTGAFHEDGLADSADGLAGHASRERALEIMRDSRVGTYGVVTLVLALGLKAALLSAVPVAQGVWLLLAGHGLSRLAAVQVMASARYARPEGGKFAAPSVTAQSHRIALALGAALTLAAALALGWGAVALGAVFGLGATLILRARVTARLGGYTGDTLGAVQQASEIALYLGAVAVLA